MLTIRTVQNIKKGATITLINGIFSVLLGLFYIFFWNFLTRINFRIAGSFWQVYSKYNPELASMYLRLFIMKGVLVIALGIAIVFLSYQIIKRKEKSPWATLGIIGIVFWPTLLTIEILEKNIYLIILAFAGWISFIVGMLVPIKYYLQRDYVVDYKGE